MLHPQQRDVGSNHKPGAKCSPHHQGIQVNQVRQGRGRSQDAERFMVVARDLDDARRQRVRRVAEER